MKISKLSLLLTIFFPLSAFSAPATPIMSDPIQMEVEAGTTVIPTSLNFLTHPLIGTANFDPNNYKVKIKDANGQEREYDVQDLLVMMASTTAKDCSYGGDELVQVVKTIFTNIFSNIGPGVFELPEGAKLDEFSEKMALVYSLTICPSKLVLIQQPIPSLIGYVEKAAISTPQNPAEITEAEKNAFLTTIDSLKIATDANKAADTFKQLLTDLEDKDVLPNGYAAPIITMLDQMTYEKKPVNELLMADIRDDGGEPVNIAQHLNPYEKGFPFAFKNLLTAPVHNNGELMGIAGVMYDNFVTPTVQVEPSIGNVSPHIVFYQWKETLKLSAIGGGMLTNKTKCNPIKSEQNGVQTFWGVEEMIDKGCWSESEPTGIVSLDFNGDGLGDLAIINRGNLPNDEDHAYATFYAGKKDVPEGQLPFEYGVMEKIGLEPYDVEVIDANNVIIATNKPDSQGVYKLSKIGFFNNTFYNQEVPVETPAAGFGPYQLTAVDLGGACQGFAFTSAQIDAGEEGKPETASITFTNKFTVYSGEKDEAGMCGKYSLVGHYSAPQAVAGEGDAINNPALLAAITFAPADEVKGLPAGLWLGDQYIYKNADGDKIAYAYFYPIDGGVDPIDAEKYRVSKAMDYLEDGLPGGGVKELRVDAYGNLGVALGYSKVWQDIPKVEQPPEPPPPPPGPPACKPCITNGKKADYVTYNEECADINGNTTTSLIANGGDADKDGVPDNCDSCSPAKDVCFGAAPNPPCYNPDQQKLGVCEKPPSQCDKGTLIKGLTYNGQQCYTNDLDCDGAADTPKGCDNCPPTSKNPACHSNYWGSAVQPCNPNSPTDDCKSRILNGVPPAAPACITTSNPDQKDSDKDGAGDVCDAAIFFGGKPGMGIIIVDLPKQEECTVTEKCQDKNGNATYKMIQVPYIKCGNNDMDCDGDADWYIGECYKTLTPACDNCPPPPFQFGYNGQYPADKAFTCTGPANGVGCPADQPCCNPNNEDICEKLTNPCGNTDTDGDGKYNDCDNCPFVSNATQEDTNKDGIGDECSVKDSGGKWVLDADGDGIANDKDNCPFVANNDAWDLQYDADKDGLGDKCDTCDTIPLAEADKCNDFDKNCPDNVQVTGVDSDGDNIDDACDDNNLLMGYSKYWTEWQNKIIELENAPNEQVDLDGDGNLFLDGCECFYSTDPKAATSITMDPLSTTVQNNWYLFTGDDKAVLPNYDYWSKSNPKVNKDACLATCTTVVYNPWDSECNTKCSEICKAGENDWGCIACHNNCASEKCKSDCNKLEGKTWLYLCGDPDKDAVCSQKLSANDKVSFNGIQPADLDNCPFAPNPAQLDNNGNGVGDACDGDIDGDDIPDDSDNCPFVANSNQLDTDIDGAGNQCDSQTDMSHKGKFTCAVVLTESCFSLCPLIPVNGGMPNANFQFSGADSDNDGVDDACDQYNLPKKHPYWNKWKQRLQQKGFSTSSTKRYDLDLISEAYADNGNAKKALPSVGTVTVLINKGASAACECLPNGAAEDYVGFTAECVEQLGGDKKPADGVPDTCSTGISDIGECFVDIGRDGKQSAGIGELNSSYDTHVRNMNDKVREMFCKAAQSKGPQANCADLRTDLFIGELGYYHVTCAVGRDTPPPAGTTPGWALFQLGGLPLDSKYFAKDNYRPSFPPPMIEIQQAGKALATISRDDLLKNSATRLVGTVDTPATAQKGIVPNVAALDFALPSIVVDKVQLAMPDKNAFAQNITVGGLNSILVDLGTDKSDPLMRVIATPLPESGDVSQLSISPSLSSQFQPGQVVQFDIEGYAGVDAAGFVHPDLAKPYVKLDPNVIFDTLADVLNQMVDDPNVKKIEYTKVMNALHESLKAKGADWDPTGYLNMRILPTMGASKAAVLAKDQQPEQSVIYMNIVPLSSLPASGLGGCGRCSMNETEAFESGNIAIIILMVMVLFAPFVWRRKTLL